MSKYGYNAPALFRCCVFKSSVKIFFFHIIYKNILKCCAKNNSLSYLKQEGGAWGSTTLWSHPPRGLLLIASFNSAGNRLTRPWNICNFRSPLESLCNHWALQPPPSRSRGESCCCCFCLAILCIFFPPLWSQRLNLKCAALELHKVFVLAEKQAEALKFTEAAVHMSHSLARRRPSRLRVSFQSKDTG